MSSAPLDYYPWYPKAFLLDRYVQVMTLEAAGLYRQMLDLEWLDGPLPAEETYWRRLCGSKARDFDDTWAQVRPMFVEKDGLLVNPRLEAERTLALEAVERAADAGRRGAAARRAKNDRLDELKEAARTERGLPKGGSSNPSSPPSRVATAADERALNARSTPDCTSTSTFAPSERPPHAAEPPPVEDPAPEEKNKHGQFVAWFQSEWLKSGRAEPYVPAEKDYKAAIRMLNKHPPTEIAKRARQMLGSADPFHVANATISLLEGDWNKWPNLRAAARVKSEPKGYAGIRERQARDSPGGVDPALQAGLKLLTGKDP